MEDTQQEKAELCTNCQTAIEKVILAVGQLQPDGSETFNPMCTMECLCAWSTDQLAKGESDGSTTV